MVQHRGAKVSEAARTGRTRAETQPDLIDEHGAADSGLRVVTQLDQSASAAGMLARVVVQSGDRCALLTYGRAVQQQLLPGTGALHLRRIIDALAQVHSESAEADHLMASTHLRHMQRRRGLVLWITEMTESTGATGDCVSRHRPGAQACRCSGVAAAPGAGGTCGTHTGGVRGRCSRPPRRRRCWSGAG